MRIEKTHLSCTLPAGVYFGPNICKVRPHPPSSYILSFPYEVSFWPLGVHISWSAFDLHVISLLPIFRSFQIVVRSLVFDSKFLALLLRALLKTLPSPPSSISVLSFFLGSWSRIVQPHLILTILLACTSIDSALVKSFLASRFYSSNLCQLVLPFFSLHHNVITTYKQGAFASPHKATIL